MKYQLVTSLLLLCTGATSVDAGGAPKLPKTLGYSFYVQGEPSGRADIKVTQTSKELIFESQTRVLTGVSVIALTSKTVADPKTFEIRDYTYKGTRGDHAVSCQAQVLGDSVYGFVESDGEIRDKLLKMTHPQTILFEDWVMEHEILLALTQAASPKRSETYGLVFTSSFSPAEITAGYTGEVLVEAGNRSFTARKLVVMIMGAEPFESHVDPKTGVPVYLRFPAVKAEVFLDEVFGEKPVTHYSKPEKSE